MFGMRSFSVPFISRYWLLCLAGLIAGCGSSKPRSFFAPDGIVVGEALRVDEQHVHIPIAFETSIIHSAIHQTGARAKLDGATLMISAQIGPVQSRKRYPGHVVVKGAKAGTYKVVYRDPDGRRHSLGDIEIP